MKFEVLKHPLVNFHKNPNVLKVRGTAGPPLEVKSMVMLSLSGLKVTGARKVVMTWKDLEGDDFGQGKVNFVQKTTVSCVSLGSFCADHPTIQMLVDMKL